MNTLDWPKLRRFVEERKPISVSAGLVEDWFWTAADVYRDGEWQENHGAYLLSPWATAGFEATMSNGDIVKVAANCEATDEVIEEYRERSRRNNEELKKFVEQRKKGNEAA